jgi:hypothetical protein
MAGIDIRRPWVWVVVEPTSAPTESRVRRVASLSLQVKGLTIGQFPNVPLALAFGAGLVSASTHGSPHAVARGVAVAATAVWGYQELVHGVNWFRRLLGVYGLVGVVGALVALIV